tara:strand:- start:649 stop:975 length:327 start_codon:yes stop_codon:yes gene_type:complete
VVKSVCKYTELLISVYSFIYGQIIVNQGTEKSKTASPEDSRENGQKPEHIPFWRIMLSVIQASIGVQSEENRKRDFTQGRLLPFIIAALIFTVSFVLLVMLVVRLALS